jgi:hypothetical protein
MTLSVVPDYVSDEPHEQDNGLPTFEGEQVRGMRARLTSTSGLELGEEPHRIDQTVRLLVTGRVVRVDHVVEDKTGYLIRVETFKVVEAVEVDWDAVSEFVLGDS